jgi:citrate synthase
VLAAHGMSDRWDTYLALREQVESGLSAKRIHANVDSITGLLYHPIGLPPSAFPIPFCLAIQTGWMAHCLEYLPDGAMLSPGIVYLRPKG